MIVPDRAISGPVSRSWSFVSSAYTGGTDKKSIAAGRGGFAQPSMFAMFEWNEGRRTEGFVVDIDDDASLDRGCGRRKA
jgi:hypothetical protein